MNWSLRSRLIGDAAASPTPMLFLPESRFEPLQNQRLCHQELREHRKEASASWDKALILRLYYPARRA